MSARFYVLNSSDEAEQVELLDHQEQATSVLLKNNGVGILALLGGAGKTLCACFVLKSLMSKGKVVKPLVVAPANILGQWQKMCEINDIEDVVFMSSQKIARKETTVPQCDYVILDEVGEYTYESQAYQKFRLKRKLPKLVISATPVRNKIEGWYYLTRLVYPDLFPKFYNVNCWKNQYTECEPIYYGAKQLKVTGWLEGKEDEFLSSLPSLVKFEVTKGDFDVHEKRIFYNITREQEDQITMLHDHNILKGENGGDKQGVMIPASIIQKRQILHHLENAPLEVHNIDSKPRIVYIRKTTNPKLIKLKILLTFLDNALIVCKYTPCAIMLRDYLDAPLINGDSPIPERRQIINSNDFVVCQVQATGVGLDGIQSSKNNIIFFEKIEDDTSKSQVTWRIDRKGQTKDVTVFSFERQIENGEN
jgi:superfamily II DNA or RNA helicase